MDERFAFINEITDEDFLNNLGGKHRGVAEKCASLVADAEGGREDTCIIEAGILNENAMKYLYNRLFGCSWEGDICTLLENNDFQEKIGNKTLIGCSHMIRMRRNDQMHPKKENQNVIDLKQEAKLTLDNLEYVLKNVYSLISDIPDRQQIQGKVMIEQIKDSKTGGEMLKVFIKDSNLSFRGEERKKNSFEWKILAKGNLSERSFVTKSSMLHLREENYGRSFVCKVTRDGMCGSISNLDNPFEVMKMNDEQEDLVEETVIKSDVDILYDDTDDNFDSIETESYNDLDNSEKRSICLPYEMKNVNEEEPEFFTSATLVHYFVRPDDYFVLNSLEKVSADVYLYRLLKNSQFEYVYFVEVEGTECVIYAYDRASQDAFPQENKVQGEKKGLTGLSNLQRKKGSDENLRQAAKSAEHGRRKLRHFSTDNEFKMQFATAIKNALENAGHKTAVVMPLRIFGKDGYCTDAVIDTLYSLAKSNETDNVLLITLKDKSDFRECFYDKQRKLHDWVNQVIDRTGSNDGKYVGVTTEYLLKCRRLVIADTYGVDEFANLLFRKIMIEGNRELSRIDSHKVYAIAESLHDYLMNERTEEKYNKLIKLKGNIMKELNKQLDRESVAREVAEKAKSLRPVRIGFSDKVNALQLERVYQEYYDRYENDNTLQEILAQFDQFKGDEVQNVISQIKGVVGYLADERARIDYNRENQDSDEKMPYMNMVFLGNPGTGKTTIAKLTARYMKAMGVLPTDRFRYITASETIGGIVGETAANIREAARQAIGGVLMIDEFQGFEEAYDGGNVAKNAMKAIVNVINEHQDDLCIIIAGYEDEVTAILKNKDNDRGAERRFPGNNRFQFKNFSAETLIEILNSLVKKRGEKIEDGADEIIRAVIENKMEDAQGNFGNAGYIESELLPTLELAKSKREKKSRVITVEDVKAAFPNVNRVQHSKEEILKKFDTLIGEEMQSVKDEIIEAVAVFKDKQRSMDIMKEKGETVEADDMPCMNMVFAGGPGTGKTTVAKLTAKYLRAEGVLPTDKYVYITATQNVEGTVGETEKKIREAAHKAAGGVLFIDEFQGFDKGHSNGNMAQDAMNAIVGIVNEHREDTCIILAGYQEGVEKVLRFDQGARRRFPNRITFKDYSVETLMAILENTLKRLSREMDDDTKSLVKIVIEEEKKYAGKSFGNGGYIKDELLLKLDKKRLKREDNNGIYIKQDVIDAYPEILGKKVENQKWKSEKIQYTQMDTLPAPYVLEPKDSDKLQRETDNAVLYITTDQGEGTAFLIHPSGYALTCYHVVKDAGKITARTRIKGRIGGDDRNHNCTVVNVREDLDMAVIKLEGNNFPYLPLARGEREIKKGEPFILSGYPFGRRTAQGLTTYQGTVATAGEHTYHSQFVRYLINCEAKSGNSGSPIISLADGLVIGILGGSIDERASETKTEEINYMCPAYYFWKEFVD